MVAEREVEELPLECLGCGYDLRGSVGIGGGIEGGGGGGIGDGGKVGGRCPECGEVFEVGVMRAVRLPWRVRATGWTFVLTVVWVVVFPWRVVGEMGAPASEGRARRFAWWVMVLVGVVLGGAAVGGRQLWMNLVMEGWVYMPGPTVGMRANETWMDARFRSSQSAEDLMVGLPLAAGVDWFLAGPAVGVMVVLLGRSVLAGFVVLPRGVKRSVGASLARYAAAGLVLLVPAVGFGVGLLWRGDRGLDVSDLPWRGFWFLGVACVLLVAMLVPLVLARMVERVRKRVLGALVVLALGLTLLGGLVPGAIPWVSPVDAEGLDMGTLGFLMTGGAMMLAAYGLGLLVVLPMALVRRAGAGWGRVAAAGLLQGVAMVLAVGLPVVGVWVVGYLRIMAEAMAL